MAVAFVPEGALEPGLEGDAIVALHGSWATRPNGQASGDPASRREHRPDGPFGPEREFSAPAGGPTVLHSIDAVAGVTTGPVAEFADVIAVDLQHVEASNLVGIVFGPLNNCPGVGDAGGRRRAVVVADHLGPIHDQHVRPLEPR